MTAAVQSIQLDFLPPPDILWTSPPGPLTSQRVVFGSSFRLLLFTPQLVVMLEPRLSCSVFVL